MWHSTRVTSSQPQTQPAHLNQGNSTALAPPALPSQRFVYGFAIFGSAFLLFEVEPLIAKIILPWFGGSAAVWGAALLFFQIVLLAGYAYAHGIVRYLGPRAQVTSHVALLALSCALLPILPSPSLAPRGPSDPAIRIIITLGAAVGLQYFLLSATSPLLQAW